MRPTTLHILAAVCGVLSGVLIGRSTTGGDAVSTSSSVMANTRERSGSNSTARSNLENKHSFAALLRMKQQGTLQFQHQLRELERLGPQRLREMVMELAATEDSEIPGSSTLLQALAEELYRRQGMAAITWASDMEKGPFQTQLMWDLINEAAFESPLKAKPWIDSFLEDHGEDMIDSFRWKLMSGAQLRGADAVIELEKLFGDRFSAIQKPAIPYPDGFDYQKLFSSIPPNIDSTGDATMFYWAETDREAAWKGVQDSLKLHGKDGALYFGAFFSGAGGLEEDPAARKWAIEKLEELPEDLRKDAVKSVGDHGRLAPSIALILMDDLPRESDRIALVSSLVHPFIYKVHLTAAMRKLGSEHAVEEAVLSAAEYWPIGDNHPQTDTAKHIMEGFGRLTDELGLAPETKAKVEAVLKKKP